MHLKGRTHKYVQVSRSFQAYVRGSQQISWMIFPSSFDNSDQYWHSSETVGETAWLSPGTTVHCQRKLLQNHSDDLTGYLGIRKVRLLAIFPSAKALCFGTSIHGTVRLNQVWETEYSNNPVGTQVNDPRSKDLIDCKPGYRMGPQPFDLTMKKAVQFSWHF